MQSKTLCHKCRARFRTMNIVDGECEKCKRVIISSGVRSLYCHDCAKELCVCGLCGEPMEMVYEQKGETT